MASKVNLTLKIPGCATNLECNHPQSSPIPPFPDTKVDMSEGFPFHFSPTDKDKKTDGEDVTGIRSDVRHAFHYYNNTNKEKEVNHVSATVDEKLSYIVQLVDDVASCIGKTMEMLKHLQEQIRDFTTSN